MDRRLAGKSIGLVLCDSSSSTATKEILQYAKNIYMRLTLQTFDAAFNGLLIRKKGEKERPEKYTTVPVQS